MLVSKETPMDIYERSAAMHRRLHGKISLVSKVPVATTEDLSLAYTPGVARPCEMIAAEPELAREMTIKHNTIGIVSDGSAVLGLGNIGPLGAIPVMEGKALLMKEFADIDAFPICLDTQNDQEIIDTVRRIAPVFGGINLEDITAPRCFVVENALQDLGIPVFHDDQHGTAIVLLAALMNAAKVTNRKLDSLKVIINGAGAAGTAIAKLLSCVGHQSDVCMSVADVIVCDSKGAIHKGREDLNEYKQEILKFSNSDNRAGSLQEVIVGYDAFIGVSRGNLLTKENIETMADDSIILAMANPVPEIMPDEAKAGGAAVIGTGRSDFPNQVNNLLAFPGIFRGALDAKATRITDAMKIAAANELASLVSNPSTNQILPDPLDYSIAPRVAAAVCKAWEQE